MATKEDYAAFSAIAYNNARGIVNTLAIPPGWDLLPEIADNPITGFTANAFQNQLTGEIVIAYKGTDTNDPVTFVQAFLFGNAAALGGSSQLFGHTKRGQIEPPPV